MLETTLAILWFVDNISQISFKFFIQTSCCVSLFQFFCFFFPSYKDASCIGLVVLLFLITKSYPTLCHLLNCSLLVSSVHGISQARILRWVAISSSRGSSQSRDQIRISCSGRWIPYHWATREAPPLPCWLVVSCVQSFCDPLHCSSPGRLLCPWDFPGKNTGVGCHFLLQPLP